MNVMAPATTDPSILKVVQERVDTPLNFVSSLVLPSIKKMPTLFRILHLCEIVGDASGNGRDAGLYEPVAFQVTHNGDAGICGACS